MNNIYDYVDNYSEKEIPPYIQKILYSNYNINLIYYCNL